MKWYAVKEPGGEWCGVGRDEREAWSDAAFYGHGNRDQAQEIGYRCVEVEFVEAARTGEGENA